MPNFSDRFNTQSYTRTCIQKNILLLLVLNLRTNTLPVVQAGTALNSTSSGKMMRSSLRLGWDYYHDRREPQKNLNCASAAVFPLEVHQLVIGLQHGQHPLPGIGRMDWRRNVLRSNMKDDTRAKEMSLPLVRADHLWSGVESHLSCPKLHQSLKEKITLESLRLCAPKIQKDSSFQRKF